MVLLLIITVYIYSPFLCLIMALGERLKQPKGFAYDDKNKELLLQAFCKMKDESTHTLFMIEF